MAEWIDVNDRLPDSDRPVWVTLKSGDVEVDWFDPYEPEWNQYDGVVIAWMGMGEFPEPYKPAKKKSIKPVDSNKHNCCDCDHYRGKVDGVMCCSFYGDVFDSCDAWEEIEDK